MNVEECSVLSVELRDLHALGLKGLGGFGAFFMSFEGVGSLAHSFSF